MLLTCKVFIVFLALKKCILIFFGHFLDLVTHLYIKPKQQTTQARTITPSTVAAVPAGEPPEAEMNGNDIT